MKKITLNDEQYNQVLALINSDIDRCKEYAEEDDEFRDDMLKSASDLTLLKVAITSQEG